MTEHVDPTYLRPVAETHANDSENMSGDSKKSSEVEKPKRPVKRFVLGTAALVVLGVGAYYGYEYWTVGRFLESTDDAYVKADSAILAPKVNGYLLEVLVDDNQRVKAGQPLARIDDRDYANAIKQADADVVATAATIDGTAASIEQQHAVIDQARSTVDLDKANLKFAEQDNDRFASLSERGSGSLQNAQQAVTRLEIAKATLARDMAAVSASQTQIQLFNAQLEKARADNLKAVASKEQAQLNLSYTMIVAPRDGVVGNRTLRVGQYVQAGTALMSVVPVNDAYIVANFKETQLNYVHAGQTVDIAIDGYPDHVLHGKVDSIAPASGQEFALLPPDNATGNFTKIVQRIPVKIKVANDGPLAGRLRPGMSVTPTISIKDAMENDRR